MLCIYEHWTLKITVFEIVCCQYVPLSTNSLTGALEAWESQPVIRDCKLLFKLTLAGIQKLFAFMLLEHIIVSFSYICLYGNIFIMMPFFQIDCSSKSDGCSWGNMLKKWWYLSSQGVNDDRSLAENNSLSVLIDSFAIYSTEYIYINIIYIISSFWKMYIIN